MSRGISRYPSSIALGLMTALVVFGLGVTMAFAGGGVSTEHPTLTCTPSTVHVHGTCDLKFHDGHASGYGGSGDREVCFSVNRDGDNVTGTTEKCSLTNRNGNAFGEFYAGVCHSAVVTANGAAGPGEPNGTKVKVVVSVPCSDNSP